jgi:hypothetical protein
MKVANASKVKHYYFVQLRNPRAIIVATSSNLSDNAVVRRTCRH